MGEVIEKMTFKILGGGAKIHLSCCYPREDLYASSLCFLKLPPPTKMEGAASFFGLFLPSMFRDLFQIRPRKLLRRLQTNNVDCLFFYAAVF